MDAMCAGLLTLVLVGTVYAVRQAVHGGLEAADLVTVLAFPLTSAALLVALIPLRKTVEGNTAELAISHAKDLSRQVTDGEGTVRRQLLGDDDTSINLRYVLQPAPARAAQAPPAGQTTSRGQASLPDILDYYRDTRPARLVITGAAGAGKTVLALLLLLDLNAVREENDPVPVRVSLAHWDTRVPLRTLLIQRLVDAYACSAETAENIVGHGLVLPVLDGLDEMDPTQPDGTPDPGAPRARAALEQLNAYQDRHGRGPAPLILTCRTTHYDALSHTDTLIDAARITIDPVDTRTAVAYLAARTREPQRWQPLLDHLDTHPEGRLARLLSTPWRLRLTATVYHRTGDPSDLLHHHSEADLDRHLLARYIPATTGTTDNPHGYTPGQVHRWLHRLTNHFTSNSPAPSTDLALHQLWPLAGRNRLLIADGLLTTLVCLLPLPLAWTTTQPGKVAGIITVIAAMAGLAAMTRESSLARLDLGRLQPDERKVLVQGLWTALWTGLVGGYAGGYMADLQAMAATGVEHEPEFTDLLWNWAGFVTGAGALLGLCALFLLSAVLVSQSTKAATLRITIREDVATRLGFGLAVGITSGFAVGIPVWIADLLEILPQDRFRFENRIQERAMSGAEFFFGLWRSVLPGPELAVGIAVGLAAGLAGGLLESAARRYWVFLLCSRGRLPFRLARFLDWACTAGLMRYSGPAYQFRHRELQQWLAAHPEPVTRPDADTHP
ncbi:NACHT domain-containing protein [Streptomyces sp. enrichment culture]|uniref:NACHT domain-containing protein n=1 Tax=Streptomyces sp. enrichment culture TaxID=1795815 RepID=UPI003F574D4A